MSVARCWSIDAYERLLAELGITVRHLLPTPELPDAVFVEDTAVVLDEIAVITRPGAPSRRPETPSVAAVLATHRPLVFIEAPATLDGGDVLVAGRRVYVGLSTPDESARPSRNCTRALLPHDYAVIPIEFRGCLHLKSAVTQVDADDVAAEPGLGRYPRSSKDFRRCTSIRASRTRPTRCASKTP